MTSGERDVADAVDELLDQAYQWGYEQAKNDMGEVGPGTFPYAQAHENSAKEVAGSIRETIRRLRAREAALREALTRFVEPAGDTWACCDSRTDETLCDYCDYRAHGYDGEHSPDCEVVQARRALDGPPATHEGATE